MNEVVTSSSVSALRPRFYLAPDCNPREEGKIRLSSKEERDLQTGTRTQWPDITRNTGLCVRYSCSWWLLHFLILFRHDARAILEEIIARNGQDRSMGDLVSIFSRRDVRGLHAWCFPSADPKQRIPWTHSSKNLAPCRPRSRR